MAKVVTTFSSDDKEIMAALAKMNAETAKLIEQNKKLAESSKHGAKESGGMMAEMIRGAADAAAGVMSIAAAWRVAAGEQQAYYQHQKDAANAQLSTANAQARLLRNVGNVTAAEKAGLLGGLKGIGKDTGIAERDIYNAASVAVSASGGQSQGATLSAMRAAARVVPDDMQELASTAGGLMDLIAVTGKDDGMSNLGYMLAMGSQTRVTSLDQINKNLVPAAISLKGFGAGDAEAGAIPTTLSTLMKDPTGAVSKTAAINLAKNMEKMFPNAGNSPLENIEAIRKNPAMLKQFMEKAGIEAEAFIPVQQMLTPGSDAAKLLASNIASFPKAEKRAGIAEAFIGDLKSSDLQKLAELERHGVATEDRMLIDDLRSGGGSVLRDRSLAAINAAEPGFMASISRSMQYAIPGRSAEEAATKMIENQLFRERQYTANFRNHGIGTAEDNMKNLQDISNLENLLKVIAENTAPIKNRAANVNQNVEAQ